MTVAWCFDDVAGKGTDAALGLLARSSARVPGIWTLEVANVLLGAESRGRITVADGTRFLALWVALPITVDEGASGRALRETLALARQHGLSSYDAAYLELALRDGVPLATRDEDLARATHSVSLTVL